MKRVDDLIDEYKQSYFDVSKFSQLIDVLVDVKINPDAKIPLDVLR